MTLVTPISPQSFHNVRKRARNSEKIRRHKRHGVFLALKTNGLTVTGGRKPKRHSRHSTSLPAEACGLGARPVCSAHASCSGSTATAGAGAGLEDTGGNRIHPR